MVLLALRSFLSAIALVIVAAAWPHSASARGVSEQHAAMLGVVSLSALPPEARHTARLIKQGGPFPYDRDGVVFRNFERILPQRDRGYYREYTVQTPGATHRGARRLVAGRGGELYYTDDHYRSFRQVRQ